MIIFNDPQGSEAWLAARRGVITGSRFKDARDYKKLTAADAKAGKTRGEPSDKLLGYAMDIARERFGGTVPAVFVNGAMRFGNQEEPVGRLEYEAETGNMVIEAGFITTDDGRFGVSVDGMVGDDGLIEIKTMVSSKTLFKAIVEADTSEYVDQCNGAMWLLGRQWIDLVLWAPDLAEAGGKGLHITRIVRDDDVINELEADLMAFAAMVDDFERRLRLKAA
jgi:exodeoxyribonuclease (lambda-induced)